MNKIKLIINPCAGHGNTQKVFPGVEEALHRMNVAYDAVWTQEPGHAITLAREAASQGYSVVAAMGGDGTVNEVVNGLVQARDQGYTDTALAVLGAGRGNDFAFGAGIPPALENDCLLLASGIRKTIDLGRVFVDGSSEPRYFGNGIGIGFDTVVGFEAAKMKHLSGFPAYLVAALKTLFFYYKPPLVTVKHENGEITQPSLMISVMNGQRMGGGFMMAPSGDPSDGLLDYCIVSYGNRLRLLVLMLNFMNGTQAGKKEVTTGRSKWIEITALQGSLPAHADGETLCEEGNKIFAEILPGSLDVLVPPQSDDR